jgi:hypothetical protein
VETSTENVTYDRQQNENQRILDDYIEARKIENIKKLSKTDYKNSELSYKIHK